MKIGVLSAMSKEHKQLMALLSEPHVESDGKQEFTIGKLGCNTLILMQCGIGKVNAAIGATTLIRRFSPDCVISTGCAGGIDSNLDVMDVVVTTQVAYHDVSIPGCDPGQVQGLPSRFRCEEQLVEVALSLQNHPSSQADGTVQTSKVVAGLICSGDQFISDHSQLSHIKELFPDALAVDMESAAIAQTCFLHAVPFVSFRILSDTPGADQHLQQYNTFWDDMADRSFDVIRRFLAFLPSEFAVLKFE